MSNNEIAELIMRQVRHMDEGRLISAGMKGGDNPEDWRNSLRFYGYANTSDTVHEHKVTNDIGVMKPFSTFVAVRIFMRYNGRGQGIFARERWIDKPEQEDDFFQEVLEELLNYSLMHCVHSTKDLIDAGLLENRF